MESPLFDPARLAALRGTGLMSSPPAEPFDRLTRLAAQLLHAPVAVVSLVDDTRQFFKSQIGLAEPWASRRETPLSHSFCRYVVEAGGPLIVNDSSQQAALRDSPAVKALNIGAYAGVPIRNADGFILGSFCVVDHEPRVWRPEETRLLADLAESVQAEIALLTALRSQQSILDRVATWIGRLPIGCLTCAPNLRLTDWNPAAERIFGYTRAEALGRLPYELLFAHAGRADARSRFERLARGDDPRRDTTGCLDRNGRLVWIEWTLTPLREPGGEPSGFVAMFEDVTTARQDAEARAVLEAQLRQKQKLESLGTLAGGVAHEFNNILGAILGNLGLAQDEAGTAHPARRPLDRAWKASLRARDLVRQVLDFARNQPAARQVRSLRPAVEEAAALLGATLPRSVEFIVSISDDAPDVLADATQIEQVIVNLVTNAWHAVENEGRPGRITLALDAAPLVDSGVPGAEPQSAGARLTVRDNGHGMDAATRDRMFDPFFTTKPVGRGTGLGLSIVYGIVQAHEGSIDVTSEPGNGTTVTLRFPAAPALLPNVAASASAVAPDPAPVPSMESVILGDDDDALRLVLAEQLCQAGYAVHPARNGVEVIDRYQSHPGSIVVIDILMDVKEGLETIFEMRRRFPEVKIVAMSGGGRGLAIDYLKAAEGLGANLTLPKPFGIAELLEAVRRVGADPGAMDPGL